MDKQAFRTELKKLHINGLTEEEIAQKAHASRQRVHGWLTGKGSPLSDYSDKIIALCKEELRRKRQYGR